MENPNNNMSDDEKLQLAQKLDQDLENFMSGLEKRQYTEGWPEDRWQEEMEKHPFFMKKAPEPGEELHPLMQGLQELKYSSTENTPDELATAYKEDGNFNFKHMNYRLAIIAYTEGLKIKCGNPEIESSLYNNRAAANYFLKNFRSALRDCESALKLKPDYDKAVIRAVNCCNQVNEHQKAIYLCDSLLKKNPDCEEALKLRNQSVQALKNSERNVRKQKRLESKKSSIEAKLIQEIQSRSLNVDWGEDRHVETSLQPQVLQLRDNMVYLNESKRLVWPVTFLYPEYKVMDFLQEFNEDDTFQEQLDVILQEINEWDLEKKYRPLQVNVYFENSYKTSLQKVELTKTLGEILKCKQLIIRSGTPSFILFAKDSKSERDFLKSYNK